MHSNRYANLSGISVTNQGKHPIKRTIQEDKAGKKSTFMRRENSNENTSIGSMRKPVLTTDESARGLAYQASPVNRQRSAIRINNQTDKVPFVSERKPILGSLTPNQPT